MSKSTFTRGWTVVAAVLLAVAVFEPVGGQPVSAQTAQEAIAYIRSDDVTGDEIRIHLNGLRRPWDYIRALWYRRSRPPCIAIKSVVVPPEYWDTGVAILLFDEMARRAAAKGYTWADLSMTGEDNPDTFDLARHMGARIYKRYRFYRKAVSAA